MNDFLTPLSWQTFMLEYELENAVVLPAFKGSVLHGIFGHALLPHKALYDALFECRTPDTHPYARRFRTMPNPHILCPLDHHKTYYRAGDRLSCKLTLVGNSADLLPDLLYVLMDMGKVKIGNGASGLNLLRFTPKPAFHLPSLPEKESCTLKLQLNTPLRIMQNGKLADIQQLSIVVNRLAERLALLAHFYCNAPFVEDFSPYTRLAEQSVLADNSYAHQKRILRYSNRSELSMNLDGWLGSVWYENVPTSLLPLFYYGQHLHFGKGNTMGFGDFRVSCYD